MINTVDNKEMLSMIFIVELGVNIGHHEQANNGGCLNHLQEYTGFDRKTVGWQKESTVWMLIEYGT